MNSVKKNAAIALERYIDSISGADYREPLPGEMRDKLEPHMRRYADSLVGKKKKLFPVSWLRPAVAVCAVFLLCCVVFIQPVRAGVLGAVTYLIDAFDGNDSAIEYTLHMEGSQMIGHNVDNLQISSQYSIGEHQVFIIQEVTDIAKQTLVNIQGTPFIVDQLSIKPYEAMCYEDEDSLYAHIEMSESLLIVMINDTDRDFFAEVLRSIKPSTNK